MGFFGDLGFLRLKNPYSKSPNFYPRGLGIFENLGTFWGYFISGIFGDGDFFACDGESHQKATSDLNFK